MTGTSVHNQQGCRRKAHLACFYLFSSLFLIKQKATWWAWLVTSFHFHDKLKAGRHFCLAKSVFRAEASVGYTFKEILPALSHPNREVTQTTSPGHKTSSQYTIIAFTLPRSPYNFPVLPSQAINKTDLALPSRIFSSLGFQEPILSALGLCILKNFFLHVFSISKSWGAREFSSGLWVSPENLSEDLHFQLKSL